MSRKHRRLLLVSGGGLVAAGLVLALPLQTPPSTELAAQTHQNLVQARAARAEQWAPEAFRTAIQAESAARLALLRANRWPPLLRRYAGARHRAEAASSLAHLALAQTRSNQATARQRAVEGLERAALELDKARLRAQAVKIDAAGRSALKRLEISLAEARLSLDRGAFNTAARQAHQVEERSGLSRGRSRHLANRLSDATRLERWRRWSAETVHWSAAQQSMAIVVDKAARRLFLYDTGALVEIFAADLGLNPLADKEQEGDNATPEGKYRITAIKAPGETRFHRALLIDYPNAADRKRFRQRQENGTIPAGNRLGGLIEIHGQGGQRRDWTNGCVALTDAGMDFLVRRVRPGTPVTIVGSLDPHTEVIDGRPVAEAADHRHQARR